MQKVILSFKGKVFRKFISFRQLMTYTNDILIRAGIILLFVFAGMFHEFISVSTPELSGYIGFYLVAIFVWGLLLIKFVISGKKIFGKTKFDIYFMGVLTFFLVSVLLSEDRVQGVFGSFGTWSYSIITLLSISIIYYVLVLFFRYSRGVKWLSLAFLLSVIIPGIYYINLILKGHKTGSLDYLRYTVLAIPLTIGILFIFNKVYLRIIAFIGLLFSLFLIAFYSNFVQGAMFILSVGVLALFLLFYFSFWVKNSKIIAELFADLVSSFRNIKSFDSFKKIFKGKRKGWIVLLVIIFMAIWIIGFASFCFRYYETSIGPYLSDWLNEDFSKMHGIKMWLIGRNDLSSEFSSMEVLNILGNYGIIATLIFILFLVNGIYVTGRLTLKLLYTGSFKNVILLSSLFVTFVSIFVNFLLTRFTPMIYLLLIFSTGLFAVIDDLISRKEVYKLSECKDRLFLKSLVIKILLIILILCFIGAGMTGILLGVEKGVY